jgi:hypothetical protein
MQPENVNPANFTVERIIFNDGEFSIAVGIWNDDETRRFAMRWNGNNTNPSDVGYPSVFHHPMWFQLPEDPQGVVAALQQNLSSLDE